jgi:hypothetical protein
MSTSKNRTATITRIAQKHLGFETLRIRWSDSKEFREVYVDKLRDALEAAYEAGRAAEAKTWVVCK